MKHTTAICAVLLSSVMTVSLASCGRIDDIKRILAKPDTTVVTEVVTEPVEESIAGTWYCDLDLTEWYNKGITGGDESLYEYIAVDEFIAHYVFEFCEDGVVNLSIGGIEESVKASIPHIREGMRHYFEDEIAAAGIDVTVDEYMQSAGYRDLDQYLDEMEADIDAAIADANITGLSGTGFWKTEGQRLYIKKTRRALFDETDHLIFEKEGNTFTLTGSVGTNEDFEMGLTFPMKFTKAE